MSIFGVKRKHVDTSALRQEISNMKSQASSQINNLNDRHTELQNTIRERYVDTLSLKQEIFNMRGQVLPQINELTDGHTELKNTVREMNINHRLLYNRVANIPDKNIISIFAESKGAMQDGEVLSFGNGSKESEAGYVMNFPGRVLGIGLSSKRSIGALFVVISVNETHLTGHGMTLIDTVSEYDNFISPLKVEAGDIINFVCKNNNSSCVRTVVSAIIELYI